MMMLESNDNDNDNDEDDDVAKLWRKTSHSNQFKHRWNLYEQN